MRCGVPTLCALLALLIAGVSAQEEAQAPGSAAVDLTPRAPGTFGFPLVGRGGKKREGEGTVL